MLYRCHVLVRVHARLDLFKKLGMIWKDRSDSASIIRENPRDKPVPEIIDPGFHENQPKRSFSIK
jgi:hypothetical protein